MSGGIFYITELDMTNYDYIQIIICIYSYKFQTSMPLLFGIEADK
jgi:hypothetical protein